MSELWLKIKDFLKERLPDPVFKVWIEPLSGHCQDGKLVVSVPNEFTKEWLIENYLSFFKEALSLWGQGLSLVFVVEEARPPLQQDLPYEPTRVLGRKFSARYTFEEFVVGDCNRLAYKVFLKMAENPRGHIIYLTAESGLGKSHLSQAAGNALVSRKNAFRVCYLTARDFTSQLVRALKSGQMENFKERVWRNCDVLMLEEVHHIPARDFTQGELALALDYLYEEEKAVVFTSTRKPHELSHLDSSLRSRLSAGMIVRINPPDYETRKNIIRRKSRNQGQEFPEEVVEYLARHLRGDIRQIESAVVGLIARASILRESVNLALAQELVSEIMPPEGHGLASVVIELVCRNFKVSREDLVSRSRKKRISQSRQVAMFLLRKFTKESLSSIGQRFNRDHATVMYALQSVEKRLSSSPSFRYQIEYLEREITERFGVTEKECRFPKRLEKS